MPIDTVPFDADLAEDAALEHAREFGTPTTASMVGELTHVFTHFRLLIRAIRVDVTGLTAHDAASGPALRWLSLDDLDAVGTPAPVRKLLEAQAQGGLF
jgi:A/G-specific adenine glycosylase